MYHKFTVKELKEKCKQYELPISGNKTILIDRILKRNLQLNRINQENIDLNHIENKRKIILHINTLYYLVHKFYDDIGIYEMNRNRKKGQKKIKTFYTVGGTPNYWYFKDHPIFNQYLWYSTKEKMSNSIYITHYVGGNYEIKIRTGFLTAYQYTFKAKTQKEIYNEKLSQLFRNFI